MHLHFVIHESFEAPGAFETWASSRGWTVGYSRVYLREPLPTSANHIDLLVVLGGPQSPSTTKDECPHFDAAAEKELISKAITAGRAVVGVCLGSQLIGEALGAPFEHSPQKEIGKFPITLTKEGRNNEKFVTFGSSLGVGHWHDDMPGLTPDCTVIAYSEGCPRQIVEYSKIVYGFQCHMEFNRSVVELLIASAESEFQVSTRHDFVQTPDVLRKNDYTEMNERLYEFLDKLVAEYQRQSA
jgi:GMP synthase (glutamine-hydrolysing)